MKHIWYVYTKDLPDIDPMFFEHKEDAEVIARHLFPNEDPARRYARIGCKPLYSIGDFSLNPNSEIGFT